MLESFEENDDALMDLLSAYKCYRLPTKTTLKEILLEISHQELIQKPRYVSNCFSEILLHLHKPLYRSTEDVVTAYKDLVPSATKVIKCIKVPETMSEQERDIHSYLVQFIKTLEFKDLSKLLRFVTGSENMPNDGITLKFVTQLSRAPFSRVCVSQLELANSYLQYSDLSEEFTAILGNEDSFRFSVA